MYALSFNNFLHNQHYGDTCTWSNSTITELHTIKVRLCVYCKQTLAVPQSLGVKNSENNKPPQSLFTYTRELCVDIQVSALWACTEGQNLLCLCYQNKSNRSQCFDVIFQFSHSL